MTFKFIDSGEHININMSSLKGYVVATYDELCEAFGKPMAGCDKTTVEWHLEFYDEDEDLYFTASIYDWKEDETPMGEHRWHVGGYNQYATYAVSDRLVELRRGELDWRKVQ